MKKDLSVTPEENNFYRNSFKIEDTSNPMNFIIKQSSDIEFFPKRKRGHYKKYDIELKERAVDLVYYIIEKVKNLKLT